MKKNAGKKSVDFLLDVLNTNKLFHEDNFLKAVLDHAKEQGVTFGEKELFILGNSAHTYQAVFGLEVYKLAQQTKMLDTTLAFSLEVLNVHVDYVSEYALTLGKQSAGVTAFKNNLQTLTDKSRLLNSQNVNKAL